MVATRRQRAAGQAIEQAVELSPPSSPSGTMSRSSSMESLTNSIRRTKNRVKETVRRKKKTSKGQGKAHEKTSERENKEAESKNRQDFGSRRVVDVPRLRPGRESEERALGPARRCMCGRFTTVCVAVLRPTIYQCTILDVSLRRLGCLTPVRRLISIHGHVAKPASGKGVRLARLRIHLGPLRLLHEASFDDPDVAPHRELPGRVPRRVRAAPRADALLRALRCCCGGLPDSSVFEAELVRRNVA